MLRHNRPHPSSFDDENEPTMDKSSLHAALLLEYEANILEYSKQFFK